MRGRPVRAHLGDLPALVVAPQDGDAIPEANLQRHQQRHRLHAVVSPIHEVPHKQVVGVRRVAPDAEKLDQVMELPVDVPADRDRALHRLHVALLDQDLPRLIAKTLNLRGRGARGPRAARNGRRKLSAGAPAPFRGRRGRDGPLSPQPPLMSLKDAGNAPANARGRPGRQKRATSGSRGSPPRPRAGSEDRAGASA